MNYKNLIYLITSLILVGCTRVKVCDVNSKVIEGADVTYMKYSLNGKNEAGLTDSHGEISIGPCIPGIEMISASHPDFIPVTVNGIGEDYVVIVLHRIRNDNKDSVQNIEIKNIIIK